LRANIRVRIGVGLLDGTNGVPELRPNVHLGRVDVRELDGCVRVLLAAGTALQVNFLLDNGARRLLSDGRQLLQ
jgi:hypothetical protein